MNLLSYRLARLTVGLVAGLALLAASPADAQAQTGSVTGTILSAATGEPLDAVQITLGNVATGETTLGGLTRPTGRFLLLNIPTGQYTLRALLIGYGTATQTVNVTSGETTTTNLRMISQAISLSEIVVTGVVGATQRTKLPFDVAQVNMRDLPVPTMNAAQALQGKVAGVTVVRGSGRPGAAPSILLRGVTSLDASGRSQEPLYIVDGVILGSSLVDLDALDIMSIEIVKGAAAASLYGSRAGNGVIQIRTRRGAEIADDHVTYTFRNEYGRSSLGGTPEFLLTEVHEYALTPDGSQFIDVDGSGCDWLYCSSPQLAGQNAGGLSANEWNTIQDQKWPGQTYDQVQRFFTQNAILQSNISASGRSGRTNFHISASFLDQEGIIINTPGFKRGNLRVNVDQAVSEKLTVQTSIFYSKSSQGRPAESSGNTIFDLTRMPAGVDLLAEDPDEPGELMLSVNPTDAESANPLYELKNYERMQWRARFLGSTNIRYAPTDWLKIDSNVSFDRLDNNRENYRAKGYRTISPSSVNTGTLYKFTSQNEALNASITASTRFNLTDQIINSTQVRYLFENEDYEDHDTSGSEFAVGDVPTLDNTNPDRLSAGSYVSTVRSDGYFLITNFDMYDKYIVDALIRNDGSSLFGDEARRQWYYRVAGAWRISQEDFFENVPFIDDLKFRYSLGTAGGRPRFSAQYETYSVSGGRISPVNLGNRSLKPEFSKEHEAGLDMAMLDYRAILTLTYAQSTTEDQILQVPQPAYSGFQSQWQNAGTIQSKTWEATLDLRLVDRPDFSWRAKILYDATKSEITSLSVPAFTYGVGGQAMGNVFYAREGEKVGTFYGIQAAMSCAHLPAAMSCDGFEVNNDGFLVWTGGGGFANPQWGVDGAVVGGKTLKWGTPFGGFCIDRSTGEETQFCEVGNTMPDYNFGISTTMSFKGLTAYALLSRSAGFDVYNQPLQWGTFKRMTGIFGQDNVPDADKKPIGYYDAWYAVSGLGPSSIFVEDASFTKLREVSLSYRFNPSQLGVIPGMGQFAGLALSLVGRNLFTWTDYRGYDPEVGKTGGDTGSSAIARVDGYTYPNFRTWTAAIEFIF